MLVDCLGGTVLQRFVYRFDFVGKDIPSVHEIHLRHFLCPYAVYADDVGFMVFITVFRAL